MNADLYCANVFSDILAEECSVKHITNIGIINIVFFNAGPSIILFIRGAVLPAIITARIRLRDGFCYETASSIEGQER